MSEPAAHESWSSRTGFLLAAIGSAVGLGNIWRFPYIMGVGGGALFILIYVTAILVFILPLLMAELVIGRRGRQSAINSMRSVAVSEGHSPRWSLVGWLGVVIALMGLSFYSVVAGWTFAYVAKAAMGAFAGFDAASSRQTHEALLHDAVAVTIWHGLFMGLTIYIVARGIRDGLEKGVNWMMPLLFVLLVVLVIYAGVVGDFKAAVRFMFTPDFSKISGSVVLDAIGQAFFTLAVGVGAMMTYGAYLGKEVSIPRSALIIATADTLVALTAGLAIFPIVFAYGLQPAEGPGLIFVTLPIAFGQMPGGGFFGTLFFILLAIAALTSAIALLEPGVSWLEEHKGWKRAHMAIALGGVVWLFGLASAFSFNIWADVRPLAFLAVFKDRNIFGILEYLTANVLIPVSGMLVAIFAGWFMSRRATMEELGLGDSPAYRLWRVLLRFAAPAGVGAVFIYNLI